MNSEFVEGWAIAQTLGEGTFGEYVLSINYVIFLLMYTLRAHILYLNLSYEQYWIE